MARAMGLLVLFSLWSLAQETSSSKLTARELFYTATKPTAAAPKQAPKKSAQAVNTAKPPASVPHDNNLPGGGKLITVSAGMPTSAAPPQTGTPVGLKYSLLKLTGGQVEEVPTDSVFHAGDRIQFRVETNVPGYLYIISQGSSGTWKPMFPSEEDSGNNHIEGFHTYTMPVKTRFYFDEQAGTEKLFLIFSREKEADVEGMIYSLQKGGKTAPEGAQPVLRASIDDQMVGRLRNTYARDLVIEAVEPTTSGAQKKESAVYVVNPTGSADSRVIADLLLVHK